jgi:hypothetical protein
MARSARSSSRSGQDNPKRRYHPNGQEDGLGREAETPEGGCLDDRHGMTARYHADSLSGQPGISQCRSAKPDVSAEGGQSIKKAGQPRLVPHQVDRELQQSVDAKVDGSVAHYLVDDM